MQKALSSYRKLLFLWLCLSFPSAFAAGNSVTPDTRRGSGSDFGRTIKQITDQGGNTESTTSYTYDANGNVLTIV